VPRIPTWRLTWHARIRSIRASRSSQGIHSTCDDPERSTAFFTESLQLRQELGNTLAIAECLEGFAVLANVAGRPRRAARLYGAAEALREITGAKLMDPADSSQREHQLADIRKRLGGQVFAAQWAAGRAIGPDEAARLALQVGGADSFEDSAKTAAGRRSILTRREREVAGLVARGLTNRQAAEQLLVATRTIETHLEHIFAKLGVQTRAEVAAWAARQDMQVQSATETPV